jgi:hypothetical protein
MKTTSNQFVDIYEKLFNLIFDTGIIPESWLLGTIKPFYKNKGNKNDPKNSNKKGDKFSPCLTPTSLEKKSDLLSL